MPWKKPSSANSDYATRTASATDGEGEDGGRREGKTTTVVSVGGGGFEGWRNWVWKLSHEKTAGKVRDRCAGWLPGWAGWLALAGRELEIG